MIDRLLQTPAFSGLGREVVAAIIDSGVIRTLRQGEPLFRPRDPYRQQVFVLCDGHMEMTRANGETADLWPGVFLGLSNYVDNHPYSSTAVAATDCTLLVLSGRTLATLEARYPALADVVNHILAERVRSRMAARHSPTGALSLPARSAMKAPMSTCSCHVSLREALRLMQERKVGSLGVMTESGELLGLFTYQSLAEALVTKGASPDDSIMNAACQTPYTIAPDAPLWKVEDTLERHGVKYLVVCEDNHPLGVISQSDVVRTLLAQQPAVLYRADDAPDAGTLRHLYENITQVAREAYETNRRASSAVRIISDAHLAIQRRCVELTLNKMIAEGNGPAPRRYAVLVMGSGGRREMLLNPDQDNGIILDDRDGPLSREEEQWFLLFAERLNPILEEAGYILCPGDIMARNPMFRQSLSGWKRQVSHMARYPNEKAARWSNIVFDFNTLYGDDDLTCLLREHVLTELGKRTALLEFMVEADAEGRPPLGWFNRLITNGDAEQKGKIDIKRNGLRIIADAARVYALSAGIANCNTGDRLRALVRQGVLNAELVDAVIIAHEELLDLLLDHQIRQKLAGRTPDKLINPDELPRPARDVLRVAMRAVKRFQDRLQGQFGRSAF